MPNLVLINGAPGSGKSTIARSLASRTPMMLALDIDQIKHSLGQWNTDPTASGLQARRLVLAIASRHLRDHHDVVIGQYLARTDFIEQLDHLATQVSADFHEVLLTLTPQQLADRIEHRILSPTRPEHAVNNQLVGPADAPLLAGSLVNIPHLRPHTICIPADVDITTIVKQLQDQLAS